MNRNNGNYKVPKTEPVYDYQLANSAPTVFPNTGSAFGTIGQPIGTFGPAGIVKVEPVNGFQFNTAPIFKPNTGIALGAFGGPAGTFGPAGIVKVERANGFQFNTAPTHTPNTGIDFGAFGGPVGFFERNIKVEPSNNYQFHHMAPIYAPNTGSALGVFGGPMGAFGRGIKIEQSDNYQHANMAPILTPITGSVFESSATSRSIKEEPADDIHFDNTPPILTPHTGSAFGSPEKRSETSGKCLKRKIEIDRSHTISNEQKIVDAGLMAFENFMKEPNTNLERKDIQQGPTLTAKEAALGLCFLHKYTTEVKKGRPTMKGITDAFKKFYEDHEEAALEINKAKSN